MTMNRRTFLQVSVAGAAALDASEVVAAAGDPAKPAGKPTNFQVACMTLPYSAFPLQRALTGLRDAGYRHVAWGTSHRQDGKTIPVLASDAPPKAAQDLAQRCRDLGLEPVMMFSGASPDSKTGVDAIRLRLAQAAAAKIPQVLTFGGSKGGDFKVWVERLRILAPAARDHGVLLVVKQHGGDTGTGASCGRITREVDHPNIKVNYDSGNVMDYLAGKVNPLTDLEACRDQVRSFCIKDHRFFGAALGMWPSHQDCGPGLGEIDHYRLLGQVAFTGLTIPLCCENIFAPRVARPTTAEGVDAMARRAREFLELVIQAIQATPK